LRQIKQNAVIRIYEKYKAAKTQRQLTKLGEFGQAPHFFGCFLPAKLGDIGCNGGSSCVENTDSH